MWNTIKRFFTKEQDISKLNVIPTLTEEEIREFIKTFPSPVITDKVIEEAKKNSFLSLNRIR